MGSRRIDSRHRSKSVVTLVALIAASVQPLSAQDARLGTQDSRLTASASGRLQDGIAQHAVGVRSIDAADEDFRDLEPLIDAIGPARVIELGEPSHGAGSAFAAKVRLIEFLHQRMGFDVLAWESGFYDVRLAQAGLRSAQDPVSAAQRGVLSVWSNAREVRPLFEYVKATQSSANPLQIVGIDMQFSAAHSDERFITDLHSFVGSLRDPALRNNASMLVDEMAGAYKRLLAFEAGQESQYFQASKAGQKGKALEEALEKWAGREGSPLRPRREDLQSFQKATDGLLAATRDHRAAFEQAHGAEEIAFMEHAIQNMLALGTGAYERDRADHPTGAAAQALSTDEWNQRDALMAANLRWWMQEGYPGRKVIVWAHNAHIMKGYFEADWRGVHAEPQPGGMKPSGAYLADWLKDDLYAIAFTTYQGEDAWANGQNRSPIAAAPEGSLEARLHRLGKPYVFLDLRAVRGDPENPLHGRQSLRISGYGAPTSQYGNDAVADLTQAFDAVFFVDHMVPASVANTDE